MTTNYNNYLKNYSGVSGDWENKEKNEINSKWNLIFNNICLKEGIYSQVYIYSSKSVLFSVFDIEVE